MKLSITLPILTAGAKKNKEGDRSVDRFVTSEVTNQCSDQVPRRGGDFDTPNQGSYGAIILNDYPDGLDCKHVVQAESSCEEINIQYRSIGVELDSDCDYDSFRFSWTGAHGLTVTPGRCSCFGDGCYSNFDYEDYYFEGETNLHMIGPDSLSVDSNTFTFYFESDSSIANGHVVIDWECVRYSTTTSTTTTTTTTTSRTTTPTTTTTT